MRDMLRSRCTFGKPKTAIFSQCHHENPTGIFPIRGGNAFVGHLGAVVEAAEENTRNNFD